MRLTYAIKTDSLLTIASGSREDWQDTLSVLKSEGVAIQVEKFSDYTGPTVDADQLLYYHHNPQECSVACPSWKF